MRALAGASPRKRGTSWVAVILVVLLGSVVGIGAGTFLATSRDPMRQTNTSWVDLIRGEFGGERYVRILMIGEDDTAKGRKDGNGLSDTLVVMALDTETKEVRAISIPRDTRVEIPGHGTSKINSAHVYGGPELTKQAVQDLLGVQINRYIKTNTHGLRGMVDLVGGVYLIVDKDMHYTDRHGGLYIDLHASPEKQLLNGKQAEGYVRFRHDAHGDSGFEYKDGKKIAVGRIVRQQMFMRALANRIMSMEHKRDRANFLATAYNRRYIVSDMNLMDWDGLADIFKDIKPESVKMSVLPGSPGRVGNGSYWIPDEEELPKAVAIALLFQDPPPTVEVLNGSGVVGAAKKIADQLEQAGFEIIRTDNAPKDDYLMTQVITHKAKAKTEPIMRIARLVGSNDVTDDGIPNPNADVTVIVGKDSIVQ